MKKVLVSLFLFITIAASGQKMVVFEKFTNMRCGSCPDAAITLREILADNPNSIWLSHHKPWDGNPLTNPTSDSLWAAMNVPGPPIAMVDRTLLNGNILSFRSQWRNLIEAQANVPSPVDIDIKDVYFDASTRLLSFDVDAIFSSIPGAGPHNLTAYIVEDSINGKQDSHYSHVAGHPLEGLGNPIWGYWHRNVVRTILDGIWGTAGVIPDAPEINVPYAHSYNYTIPGEYDPSKMSIVVTVSKFNENNNADRLIYNGARYELRPIISSNKNLDVELGIILKPNPARNFVDLSFKKVPETLTIVDVTGRTVRNVSNLSTSMKIDLNNVSPGLYYLVARTKEGLSTKALTIIP